MPSDTSNFPIKLSTAELAFMLTLLEVPHVIGVDNAALFPSDDQRRADLLAEGKQQLEASGKLAWQPELLAYHPDDVMVALLVPLAFPDLVLTCVVQTHPDRWQEVTYSWANQLVVETVIIDGVYHLSAFLSFEVIMARLIEALNLPLVQHDGSAIVIPRSTFAAVRNPALPPSELPLPAPEAARLIQIVRHAVRDLMFSVFRVQQTEIVAVRFLGVIVDLWGAAWLVTPQEPEQMRLYPTSGPALSQVLMHYVTELEQVA